ncbi:hypothetical protein BCS95_15040 [Vibrio breoganii]|uniref:glycosyltransferase n=1 Tax=Vibrio breoganii TaxID=553239 RepID=UPI000C84D8CC|nr:glycosyltransferase [Vibrio breoganii]PMP01118.1 hypothetical protein BCS95_15040 [Vibrio breoganii]
MSYSASGISVLMSVYKNEKAAHLELALRSIWTNQTVKPSQLVLVEDGPLTEELYEVIFEWQQKLMGNFKSIKLPQNQGLADALNEGLKYCDHELIARMDTDDESYSNRIAEQLAYMNANPNIAASSAQLDEYDIMMNKRIGERTLPLSSDELKTFCKTRSPLSHPVAIFRKNIVEKIGGYPRFKNSQDWALWSLMIVNGYQLANINLKLLRMRTDTSLLERRGKAYFKNEIELYKYQNNINFITKKRMIMNIAQKSVLRLSPKFIKKYLYQNFR